MRKGVMAETNPAGVESRGCVPRPGESHVIRDTPPRPSAGRSLWLWVAAGFLCLAVLWVALFLGARAARIESVPLTTKEASP